MQVFAGHTGAVQCGEFTPDGKHIVTADADGNLIYWDPRSPSPQFKLTAHDARFDLDGITSLAINPASTLAVVGGVMGGVRVVSLSKGEVVSALGGHKYDESVEAVVFVDLAGAGQAGTGGVVVTGGTDGKACIWDLGTMRLRATLEHQACLSYPFSPRDVLMGKSGRDHFASQRAIPQISPSSLRFRGPNPQDLGRENGNFAAGAQRSPWPRSRRFARCARSGHRQRWRRWRVPRIPNGVNRRYQVHLASVSLSFPVSWFLWC